CLTWYKLDVVMQPYISHCSGGEGKMIRMFFKVFFFVVFCFCFCFLFFKTGFLCVLLAVLELTL
ncbi:mCG140427, partial [Mus musculus]